jgi:hypothetical protein
MLHHDERVTRAKHITTATVIPQSPTSRSSYVGQRVSCWDQRGLTGHLSSLLAGGGADAACGHDDQHRPLQAGERPLGTPAGAQALQQVAARYGSEEFVIVRSAESAATATRAAERPRLAIQAMEFVPKPDTPSRLTISIGPTPMQRSRPICC